VLLLAGGAVAVRSRPRSGDRPVVGPDRSAPA
jgi:hypothetical protein